MNYPILIDLNSKVKQRKSELISVRICLPRVFVRLTKVRCEESMHMHYSIHTKEILKNTPFILLTSGEQSPNSRTRHLKNIEQKSKVFTFGMPT